MIVIVMSLLRFLHHYIQFEPQTIREQIHKNTISHVN